MKFCVNDNFEKKMTTSLCWDGYPVNQTLQNSTDFAVLDTQYDRRAGEEIWLFYSIELLVDWYKTFILGGIMSM